MPGAQWVQEMDTNAFALTTMTPTGTKIPPTRTSKASDPIQTTAWYLNLALVIKKKSPYSSLKNT